MKEAKSPLHKLKTLLKTTELIDDCIKKFYFENDIPLKKVHYDADQFLSIFIYIVIQAQIENLYLDCKIIENFTNSSTLNSLSGYLLITLTGCIYHISEI